MHSLNEENKIAFTSCIEVVLMRRGNIHYHSVLAKLQAYYNCGILECLDHPENLRDILKEVFRKDYNSVLDDIGAETEQLEDMDEFKISFFKFMAMSNDNYKVRKALISETIEKSLLAIGQPVYDEVMYTLKKEYDCYLSDCYNHPEYLKKTLQTLFGRSSATMIESIKNHLEKFAEQNGVNTFIAAISD